MVKRKNEYNGYPTYIIDDETRIWWDGKTLHVERPATSWDEQACLIPVFLLVAGFEGTIFFILMAFLKFSISNTGNLWILLLLMFFGVVNIPGVALLFLIHFSIFSSHCILNVADERYKLSTGLLRLYKSFSRTSDKLIISLLYSRGDWGFNLKLHTKVLCFGVNLPIVSTGVLGCKTLVHVEIMQLIDWLKTNTPFGIDIPIEMETA